MFGNLQSSELICFSKQLTKLHIKDGKYDKQNYMHDPYYLEATKEFCLSNLFQMISISLL